MGFYERLGIDTYINAHDTYTIYGGSRMAPETLRAMAEAAEHFVDIEQMQQRLGEKIAAMTRNEGAYITNGAAGGLTLAAAVCMAKGDMFSFSRLPDSEGLANEIIVMRSQRNAYDKAIEAAGATIVEMGDADETLEYELRGRITQRTAALFYFQSSNFERASMPLAEAIRIAHEEGIPVVVDAAAQLPPASNLWHYTKELGADLAIFSGGKTLCGPQDSGLIVGRKALIADCLRFGAPVHGVCRGSKTSRETMAGFFVALERYLAMDEEKETARQVAVNAAIAKQLEAAGLRPVVVPRGPVGQTYPRVFGYCPQEGQAARIAAAMAQRHIYIGLDRAANAVYFSPLNLSQEEVEQVCATLADVLAKEA